MIDANPNRKYVAAVTDHWLDKHIQAGRRKFVERVLDNLKSKEE
jgi:hypothetical protein